jgi:hypothetical protein
MKKRTDMRTRKLRCAAALLMGCAALSCTTEGQQPTPAAQPNDSTKVNRDAQLLEEFQKRIADYQDLHKKMAKEGPKIKETADPAKINEGQDVLARNIQSARKDAKAGDIFTPEIRQLFRRLMYPELKGSDGAETKQVIKEDAPAGVSLKVNAKYPENQPLPTVPANLLASLPRLPKTLEYRIVEKHLILRDVDANLIVDFIPNAIR